MNHGCESQIAIRYLRAPRITTGAVEKVAGTTTRCAASIEQTTISCAYADFFNRPRPLMTPGGDTCTAPVGGTQSPDSESSRPSPILADFAPPSGESDRQFVVTPSSSSAATAHSRTSSS